MMGFELIVLLVLIGGVVLVGGVLLIGVAAYALGWRPRFNRTKPAQTNQNALEILKARCASGELSKAEYEGMSRDLEGLDRQDKPV